MRRRAAKKQASAADRTKRAHKRASQRQRKVQVQDALVKKHWDNKKTLNQNLASIGIVANSNDAVHTGKKTTILKANSLQKKNGVVDEIEEASISDALEGKLADAAHETSDQTLAVEEKEESEVVKAFRQRAANDAGPVIKIQSDGERSILEKLVKKHGNNFKAMERDIKLNTWQHTARQLEKKCMKYIKENEASS